MTPIARTRHQAVVGWLTYRFAQWVEAHGGVILPGCNVDLDAGTHLEPDVAFVRPGRDVGDVLALHERHCCTSITATST